MKTLLLLRHAKSSWNDPALGDRERPLNKRGRHAAALIGDYLAEAGLVPDLALVSSAVRSEETWQRLLPRLSGHAPECRTLKGLYLAPPSRILQAIHAAPDAVERLLVLGHNPGLEHLAERLAGPGSDRAALQALRGKFPTAALAIYGVVAKRWHDLEEADCQLIRLVLPRDLESGKDAQRGNA